MLSTMQDQQLGLPLLLRHVARVNGRSKITSAEGGLRKVLSFAELAQRAGSLGSALKKYDLPTGTVVGTLAGATTQHLEAYLGVPASGNVLHTLNVRLHDDQLAFIARKGEDRVLLADSQYIDRAVALASAVQEIELLIVVGASGPVLENLQTQLSCDVVDYEEFVLTGEAIIDWPSIDERDAAIMCFTGGTTGLPKGVIYSHRALWLQAMSLCCANTAGLSSRSKLLPAVPLYHVNGWGLPFAALMAGSDLVLPGASLRAKDLVDMIDQEAPDIVAGVPTIWSDVLDLLEKSGRRDMGAVRTISCGGALVPRQLYERYKAIGVRLDQGWGMTETLSMSAQAQTPPWASTAEEIAQYAMTQGRIVCGLEVRLMDLDGAPVPSDGIAAGEVQIRGPWVTSSYLSESVESGQFQDGWLRTGDLGTIDSDGFISLSDRVKDAIKSGGEWIPSLALEEAIRAHPAICDVAVVAVPDLRWQERPGGVLVLQQGCSLDTEELKAWLNDRVARWWIPDAWIFVDELPRTTVGKTDKKLIRKMFLTEAVVGGSKAAAIDQTG